MFTKNAQTTFLICLITANINFSLAQTAPGEVAKDAVYLDAKALYPFSGGVAVIQKGTKRALINKEGKFIIPFSEIIVEQVSAPANGLFMINGIDDNGKPVSALINNKGERLVNLLNKSVSGLVDNSSYDCAVFKTKSQDYLYVFPNSETISSPKLLTGIREGMGIENKSGASVYWNLNENKEIPGTFFWASPFSNGIGIVAKKNEVNQIVYGAVNRQGDMVLPFQFSKPPKPFLNNHTVIEPRDKNEFDYAYFNNSGVMVRKVKRSVAGGKNIPQGPFIKNRFVIGYSNEGVELFDSNWKMTPLKNLLAAHHVDVKKYNKFLIGGIGGSIFPIGMQTNSPEEDNSILWFNASEFGKHAYCGFINFDTKRSIPPIFYWQGMIGTYRKEGSYGNSFAVNWFDPVSKLAFVSLPTKFDEKGEAIEFRNGFIDETGIFRIVLQSASKW